MEVILKLDSKKWIKILKVRIEFSELDFKIYFIYDGGLKYEKDKIKSPTNYYYVINGSVKSKKTWSNKIS